MFIRFWRWASRGDRNAALRASRDERAYALRRHDDAIATQDRTVTGMMEALAQHHRDNG